MVRKVISLLFLIGLLTFVTACGRSRVQTSDTPVPTLTSAPIAVSNPTVAATATEVVEATEEATIAPTDIVAPSPTGAPTVAPTVAPTEETTATVGTFESTPEMTATEELTDSETLTATSEATPTEDVASSAQPTATEGTLESTPDMTVTVEMAETEAVTATPEVTRTEEVAASVESTATISSRDAILEMTATVEVVVTQSVTATSEATLAEEATATEEAWLIVEATSTEEATPTEEVTPTADPTVTVAITQGTEITDTVELTVTAEATELEESELLPRESISLPTDLPTAVLITGARYLNAVVDSALPMVAELSPDGNRVAWLVPAQGRQAARICLADIGGRPQGCEALPGYAGLPYHLVWSPDSAWIALSEDPAAQALESDIWLLNVADGTVTNRTDDGEVRRYEELESEFALDYLPMWDPATGALYFWRSSPNEQGDFDLALMRLDPQTEDAPELVRTVDGLAGDGLIRFGWQRFYLQGPASIAPDGSQLAVVVAPAQEMDVAESQALWLINLVETDAEPTQLATALTWQSALPQWSNQPAVARGLQWTADGQGIVVAALSSDLRLPLLLAYYVDVASGDVEPVVDFSASRDRNAFFKHDPMRGQAARLDVPWTVALAPNANVLLMVTDLGGVVRILGAPLPPTGAAPVVLYEFASPGYEVWTRASGGENGTVLVYGLLLESEVLE